MSGCRFVEQRARNVFYRFSGCRRQYGNGQYRPSGAADVAVAILTAQSAPVHLNGGTLLDPGAALPTAAAGPVTLNYLAAYKSLSTAVTPVLSLALPTT